MKIRLLHEPKCTAAPHALQNLREVMDELGIDIPIEDVLLTEEDDPAEWFYYGSPTIQVNGSDIDPLTRGLEEYGHG